MVNSPFFGANGTDPETLLAIGIAGFFAGLLWIAVNYEEYTVKQVRAGAIYYQPRWSISVWPMLLTAAGAGLTLWVVITEILS